jgi:hypothetical protein
MKTKLWLAVAGGLVVASAVASSSFGGRTMAPMQFTATLTTAQEVMPKEKGAPAMAGGKFTAVLTGSTLKWTLTFSHLSGPAIAAHVHMGAKGKAGAVLIPLCGPCKTTSSGTPQVTAAEMKAMSGGMTYVNVHTKLNPNGEIRGQVM